MYLDNVFAQGNIGKITQRKVVKPVVFSFKAPQAQRVTIMGDFNNWNPEHTPMIRQIDGGWRTEVPLSHGHHRYVFVVDSELTLDPRSNGITRNDANERVCLCAVS